MLAQRPPGLAVLATSLLLAAPLGATALGREPGAGQLRLVSTTFVSSWAYDDDGAVKATNPLHVSTLKADLELGVVDGVTLRAVLPISYVATGVGDALRTDAGPADAIAGLQLRLTDDGPVALSTRLDAKVPLYSGAPTVEGRAADGGPARGDGQLDVTGVGLVGGYLPFSGALSGFIDLEAGYRLRTGPVSDAAVGSGRLGLRMLDSAGARGAAARHHRHPRSRPGRSARGAGFASLGPWTAIRLYESLHLEVGASYVGRGTNAPGGVELAFGLWWPFR